MATSNLSVSQNDDGIEDTARTPHEREANFVLTLEEIASLAKEGGKPAETLMNVAALIADGSRPMSVPRTCWNRIALTWSWPPRSDSAGNVSEPCGWRLDEGLTGLVAEQVRPVAVEHVKNHPRFKYFSEAGEDVYQSFLGVPLIDRGVLQGVLVVQTVEARVVPARTKIRMLVEAAAQVAPVVSEARTLDRFIAPAQERLWSLARNLWWSWDHDSSQPLSRPRSGTLEPGQSQSGLTAGGDPPGADRSPRRRTGAAQPDQLRLPPAAGISPGGPHLGRDTRGRSAASSRGLLSQPSSDCTSRFRCIPAG